MSASPRNRFSASDPAALVAPRAPSDSTADGGRSPFAAQHGLDRAFRTDREHDDRYTVFAGKRKGGGVHDLQVAVDRFLVGEPLVARRLGVEFRGGGVNAADIG